MIQTSLTRRVRDLFHPRVALAIIVAGVVLVGSALPSSQPAQATAGAINNQINFQGRLLNAAGAVVADGNYNMKFIIYRDGTGTAAGNPGGTSLWTEEWLNSNGGGQGVTVKNGYFSVQLGTYQTLPATLNESVLWLSMNVAGTPNQTSSCATPFLTNCTPDGEMVPMKRLASAVYALNAGSANTCTGCILQTPTATAQNTISPNQASATVALTVNANAGVAASLALDVRQTQAADGINLAVSNATGTATNGLAIAKTAAGTLTNGINVTNATGTLTNGIAITQSSGTLSNGLVFGGTIAADITTAAASNRDLTISPNGTGKVVIGGTTPTLNSATALTLSTGSNSDLNLSPNGSGDILVSQGAGSNMRISASAAPTVDQLSVSNSGQASTTPGVDGLVVTFGASNASGDAAHLTPSFAGGATDLLTYNALEVDAFSPTNAAGTDTINGMKFGNLTDPGATVVSTALNIGSGWDNVLSVGGTPILNSTGIIQSAGVSGSYTGITGVGTLAAGTWQGTAVGVLYGGTGQTTIQAAINSLSGLTTEGDLLYRDASNATRLARGSNGQCLTASTTTILWGACGSGVRLDQVAAATTTATIANAANAINWNWQFSGAATGLNFGETAASTGGAGNQFLLQSTTASGSTASPLRVTSTSTDVGDIVFNLASAGDMLVQDNGTTTTAFNDDGTVAFTNANINTGGLNNVGITSTFNPSGGGAQTGLNQTITNAPTVSANTATGQAITITDNTTLANTVQGIKITVNDTASAAKTVTGLFVDLSGSTNSNSATKPTGILVKGAAAPTSAAVANLLLDLQDSAATSLFKVANTGAVTVTAKSANGAGTGDTSLMVTGGTPTSNNAGGKAIQATGGTGGTSATGSPAGDGGVGLQATGGTGGANSSTGVGGAGGAIALQGGTGGAAATGAAGIGGALSLTGGTGGALTGVGTPSAGGGITIAAGAGGAGTSTSANGSGGAITLQGGAAGTGGSGAAGGAGGVTVQNGGALAAALAVKQSAAAVGTVGTTNLSAAVTGAKTTFMSTFQPGDTFTVTASGNTCVVKQVFSDTSLSCVTALTSTQATSAYSFTPQTRLAVSDNGRLTSTGSLNVTNASSGRLFSQRVDAVTGAYKLSGNSTGYAVPQTTTDNNTDMVAAKFNSGSGGTVSKLCIYFRTVNASNLFKVAIYTDSSGPSALVSSATAPTTAAASNQWNCSSLGGTYTLAASTNYWLAFTTQSGATQYGTQHFSGTGTGFGSTFGGFTWGTNFPSGPVTGSSNTDLISVYAPYETVLDQSQVAAGISLNDNNELTVTPISNSSSVFNINNIAGSTVLSVSTKTNEGLSLLTGVELTIGGAAFDGANYSMDVLNGAGRRARIDSADSNTVPNLVLQAGLTPGSGADLLQFQNDGGSVLASFSNAGVLNLGRSSGLTGGLNFLNSTNANVFSMQAGATAAAQNWILPTAFPGAGQCLQSSAVSAPNVTLSFSACGAGGSRLDQIAAATTTATIANATNAINWNWQFTAAGTGLSFGETAASTGGSANQWILQSSTLAGSTASPFRVTSNSVDAADIAFNLNSSGDFEIQDAGVAFATFDDAGKVTLGKSSAASAIDIGVGTGVDTINIGTGGTGTDVIIIGDTSSASTTTLRQGTGDLTVNLGSTGDFVLQDNGTPFLTASDSAQLVLTGASTNLVGNGAATGTTGTTSAAAVANTTTVTIVAAGAFANNDVIFINNAGQDYYTRIVSGGGTTSLTVSPMVSYDASVTITKYNVQNIGALSNDYTTLSNRLFQGYFLGGVVTGAGSTTLSDGRLLSTNQMIVSATGLTIQNTANSINALLVTKADGTPLLGVDSANGSVNIGRVLSGTGSSAGLTIGDDCGALQCVSIFEGTSLGAHVAGDSDVNEIHGWNGIRLSTNSTFNGSLVVNSSGQVGVGTETPDNQLTVQGDMNIRDATTATKQYRFRTSGTDLDLEAAGANLWLSGWTGAGFTGTQSTFLRGAQSATIPALYVGGGLGVALPTLLVVDNKNTAGDPAATINGSVYYNSNTSKFRCYQAAWKDCMITDLQATYDADAAGAPAEILTSSASKTVRVKAGNTFDAADLFTVQTAAGVSMLSVSTNGTPGVDLGSVGSVTSSSTIDIANTSNATGTQTVNIGSNANTGNAVLIEGGNTGQIKIGTASSTHTIGIGSGATAAQSAQLVNIGSPTTSSASKVTLQGGNLTTTNANSGIVIGLGYGTDTNLVPFNLDATATFTETASTCTASANGGAMYYNSAVSSNAQGGSNAIRACINGAWEDLASTAGLGILLFGVVPDTGTTAGDIVGVSALTSSPCKVTWSATQQVTVNPCTAYSGGRKIIVSTTTISTALVTASAYVNICLTGTNNGPALVGSTGNAAETSATIIPSFSASNPVLCLATIRASGTAGNVGNIWDTRTFTNTLKQFATVNSANSNGYIVNGTATMGVVQTVATAATGPMRGVIVATAATVSTNTVNAIIATRGQTPVKFIPGAAATINNHLQTTTTAGYGVGVASPAITNFADGGLLLSTISTSCTTAATMASACQYAPMVDFSPVR